jgi:iron complex transport system substrate-binding protein
MNPVTIAGIKGEGGFSAIRAVREGQIYIIDEQIVSRPTMRLLEGIYEIGRILYPGKVY